MNTEFFSSHAGSNLVGVKGFEPPASCSQMQNIIFDFYSIYAAFEHFMSTVCPFILNNPPTENGKEGGVI